MKKYSSLLIAFLISAVPVIRAQTVSFTRGNLRFAWNLEKDSATVSVITNSGIVWKGTLMPAWWLSVDGKKQFVKASLVNLSQQNDSTWVALLKLGSVGKSKLIIQKNGPGIKFKNLEVQWINRIPAIISMYFGVRQIDPAINGVSAVWDKPFVPTWQATGFCVPGAKEGPAQSYFRNWDFGQSNIALGSFGPSTGSPYGAAYPRPLLYAGMGSNDGIIVFGSGKIPDAAMSLRTIGAKGCLEYLYREDLWGALQGKTRIWNEPLRIFVAEDAYNAFALYYASFQAKKTGNVNAAKATWNSWGTWMNGRFKIRPIVDMAKKAGASIFELDGSWESSEGAATPNKSRFPNFEEDVEYARKAGFDIGVWESIGWIADPFSQGLTEKDLLLNKYGKPCKSNWNFDPHGESFYCLDPSSEGARQFLVRRTEHVMKILHPKLIKLDFGYGLPSPDMATPRNPAFRGEGYAFELVHIISEAAKKVDPEVAMMYYSISPLWTEYEDVVSLDDQGDLWYAIKDGHASWSIWASLLGNMNTAISGSSGYDWEKDEEVVLNTCIIGVPGCVLPVDGKNDQPVPPRYLNRRLAVNNWFRRTTSWKPDFLNSHTGDFSGAPVLNSWGRLEEINSVIQLTALVLRQQDKEKLKDEDTRGIQWTGRWALIAQDNQDILHSAKLAMIPFDSGSISIPWTKKPQAISRKSVDKNEIFTSWNWDGKSLTIHVDQDLFENTAGFLIE